MTTAHTDAVVDRTVEAVAGALGVYAKALDAGSVDGLLFGRPVRPVFRPAPVPTLSLHPGGDGALARLPTPS